MKRRPDFLAAEARRWLAGHKGPRTEAVDAVRHHLADYYADGAVLDALIADRKRLVVRFPAEPKEHTRRLMDALGATVVIDPSAPASCPCGCKAAIRTPLGQLRLPVEAAS